MNTNFTKLFILSKRSYFPPDKIQEIKYHLQRITDNQLQILDSLSYKDPNMVFFISFFAGYLGVDHYLINKKITGTLKLLTLGGCGIWMFIDWIFIIKMTRNYNYKLLIQYIESFTLSKSNQNS